MKLEYLDVSGIRTRCYSAGAGNKALLLVHGFGMAGDTWARVIDPLADLGYRVLAPDLLGHGFTDFPGFGTEPPQVSFVHHLAAFADLVGLEDYCAVGSSLGGTLVPLLYLARPDRVRRLIVVGIDTPVSRTGTLDPDVTRAAMENGRVPMEEPTLQNCIERLSRIMVRKDTPVADVGLIQLSIYAQPDRLRAYCEAGKGIIAAADDDRVRIRPEKIKVPTLMLCGAGDIRANVSTIRSNYRLLPKGELEMIERCGHLPEMEAPDEFVEAVDGFLRRTSVAS